MDAHTLSLLEFERIRELVSSYAASPLGREAALQMSPSFDLGEVRHRQALTTEMTDALSSGLTPPLGGLLDVRGHVRRAQVGATLEAEELAEIASSLKVNADIQRWLARIGDQFPRLGGIGEEVSEFSELAATIETCLDDRGRMLDTASRRLSMIRRDIDQAEQRIQDTLNRMLRSPEIRRILRYPNFTMVGHHYVLPVSKDHRGALQGAVQRTSASNETVYIEPLAVAEQSAQLAFHRAKETKEVRRILRWLSAQVGQVGDSLLSTLQALAVLDHALARGRYSIDYRLTPPDLNTEGRVSLRGARHPILEHLFREEAKAPPEPPATAETVEVPAEVPAESQAKPNTIEPPPPALLRGLHEPPLATAEVALTPEPAVEPLPTSPKPPPPPPSPRPKVEPRKVVPIDVHLGLQFQILVITGPNTGGKTVALKTVGLLAIMAQCGLHIPAIQGSQLPMFDAVLADIGDEQSLEQSLSTFSSHVRRITEILGMASENSLILMDELGAGTDPAEGAALGRALLDELDSIGCRAIVTTHIGDLKTYAFTNPRAENAAVEFDIETLRPLYKVRIGDIGQSNALQIARRLAMPEHLVDRASRYLQQTRGDQAPEWEVVQKLRKDAEDARQEALQQQAEAQRTRDALTQKLADLQTQAEHDTRIQEARARLQPGDRVVVPKFGYDRPGRIVKLDPRKNTALVAIGMMKWDVSIEELIPQLITTPEAPAESAKGKTKTSARDGRRLD